MFVFPITENAPKDTYARSRKRAGYVPNIPAHIPFDIYRSASSQFSKVFLPFFLDIEDFFFLRKYRGGK